MIPDRVFEQILGTPASQQMREAAAELAARIVHGEFDVLDEAQRADLLALVQMLQHWSRRVLTLEGGLIPHSETDRPHCTDS